MSHVLDNEKLTGMNLAQNLLKEFQPRSRASQDKATILYNLCLIYSKEPKQMESAVHVLSDMMEKKVSLGFKETGIFGIYTHMREKNIPYSTFWWNIISQMYYIVVISIILPSIRNTISVIHADINYTLSAAAVRGKAFFKI